MRLGVGFLTYQRGYGAFARAAAARAAAAGFHSVWFSEHHFGDDGYLPSAVPAMADVLAGTRSIGVGAGVALLPFHDVPRLDAGLRVLERTGRPVLYAAGIGYRDEEFDGFGLRRRDRGRIFEAKLADLAGRLAARSSTVELWVGAIARVAVERAARFGLPVLFPPGTTGAELGRRLHRYREVAGRPARFGLVRDVVIGGDREYRRVAEPMYRDYLHRMVVNTPSGPVRGAELGPAETAAYFDRMRANTLLGPAEVVAAEMRRLAATGADLAVLRCWYPTASDAGDLAAVDALAAAVLPAAGARDGGAP